MTEEQRSRGVHSDVHLVGDGTVESLSAQLQWVRIVTDISQQLSETALPAVARHPSALLDVISTCTGSAIGQTIYRALQPHFETSDISGFRVNVVHSFTNDHEVCTVLEWESQSRGGFVAIFDVDPNDPGQYNYLMHWHHGPDGRVDGTGKELSTNASVSWNLCHPSAIRSLLERAQHVLGILELPKRDVDILYRGNRQDTCSAEEYTPSQKEINLVIG